MGEDLEVAGLGLESGEFINLGSHSSRGSRLNVLARASPYALLRGALKLGEARPSLTGY